MKKNGLRILSGLAALMISGSSYTLVKLNNAKAEGTNDTIINYYDADLENPKMIQIVDVTPVEITEENNISENNIEFGEYTVVRGDNASIISKKICKHVYHIEPTTKYWPVIAFLNGYPRVIHAGDVIVYPKNLKDMEKMLTWIKSSNNGTKDSWLVKYLRSHRVYFDGERYLIENPQTAGEIFDEMFGKGASKNIELFNYYLKVLGIEGKYTPNTLVVSFEGVWELTEGGYTLFELKTDMEAEKRK